MGISTTVRSSVGVEIVAHLPRTSFSEKQNAVISWAMQVLGVPHVPSPGVMRDTINLLQSQCGIRTIQYQGALGHVYYANDLCAMIAQVILN